ncbi:MAG: flippase-like domain-containing protein [Nitrospinae bacterium]|nr:flippase-like domain-containing protein [Nitrospinota bacterium]
MKTYGTFVISCLIAVLAVYYTMRNVSLSELMDSFRTLHYSYLLMAGILLVLLYWARALRWRMLIAPLKTVKTSELYSPLMVGFMASVLPARIGEIVRAYLLAKNQQLAFASSLATILVERLFDLTCLLLLFAWLLVFHSGIFDSGITWSGFSVQEIAFQFGIVSMVLIAGLMAFIYFLINYKPKAVAMVRWVLKPVSKKWKDKVEHLVEAFCEGLEVVRDLKGLTRIGLTTFMVWALMVGSYYPFYWAYDLQDKSLSSLILLVVMVCILITILPTPAFLGSFNAGVLIALHHILHESEVAAVSFGMVAWAMNFLVIFLGGFYFIMRDRISFRQLADEIQEEEI